LIDHTALTATMTAKDKNKIKAKARQGHLATIFIMGADRH
jgi:deoxyribose-phosphate aldolase